jgi:putative endonuclease
MDRIGLGRAGERAAVAYLKSLGFSILETDYRLPFAQIDIIAQDKRTIVFVEVKTRRSHRFGWPEEAVTPWKQRRLISAATCFLASRDLVDRPYRFDVVAVTRPAGGRPAIRHFKSAFP